MSDRQLCAANLTATATKEVTITATITWTGTGQAPTRILVSENATVSWSAELGTLQSGGGGDDAVPPPSPSGTMDGSGETGLTDVATKTPNPWTN